MKPGTFSINTRRGAKIRASRRVEMRACPLGKLLAANDQPQDAVNQCDDEEYQYPDYHSV